MWLDLEPILHRASCIFAEDQQNPSGIRHGGALLVVWLDHVLHLKGVTSFLVTVSRLGGLGHQHFSHLTSATCCVAVPLPDLRGSDESGTGMATQTKRPGGSILLIRALFGSYRPYG